MNQIIFLFCLISVISCQGRNGTDLVNLTAIGAGWYEDESDGIYSGMINLEN